MTSALISISIVVSVGLAFFFVIGQLIDAVVVRIAVGPGDPFLNILAEAKYNPRRRFIVNRLRPIVLTVIIYGGTADSRNTAIGYLGCDCFRGLVLLPHPDCVPHRTWSLP